MKKAPVTPEVTYLAGVGYFVASKSVPGAWRLVKGDWCSCPATRKSCRHHRLVDQFVRANAPAPRPLAPVHISALVD